MPWVRELLPSRDEIGSTLLRRRRLGAKTSARMPDLRSGKRVRGGGESTPRRAEPCRRLNKHAPETARLLSRAERALRRADVVAAAAPPLPDVREQLAAEATGAPGKSVARSCAATMRTVKHTVASVAGSPAPGCCVSNHPSWYEQAGEPPPGGSLIMRVPAAPAKRYQLALLTLRRPDIGESVPKGLMPFACRS